MIISIRGNYLGRICQLSQSLRSIRGSKKLKLATSMEDLCEDCPLNSIDMNHCRNL